MGMKSMPWTVTAGGVESVGSTTLKPATPFVVMTKTKGQTTETACWTPAPTPPCETEKWVASEAVGELGTEHDWLVVLHTAALQAPTSHVVRMQTCHVVSHLAAVTQLPPASASPLQSVSVWHPVATTWAAPSTGVTESTTASFAGASAPDSTGVLASSPGGWFSSDLSMPREHPAETARHTATARQAWRARI